MSSESVTQLIEIARLRTALADAIEDIASWGSYASEYFQQKHDLAGCIAKHKQINTPSAERPIRVNDLVTALERSAANTDTDWRWLAAAALRGNDDWQQATIQIPPEKAS